MNIIKHIFEIRKQGNKIITPRKIPLPDCSSDQIENGISEQIPAKRKGKTKNINVIIK
jgi:hypothetical protein